VSKRWEGLPDPRKPESPEDVDYSVGSLVFLCVLMFACRLGARRQVRHQLFTTFLVNLYKVLFDVDSVPHGDTMNGVLCGLPFEGVQELVCGMTETLIDKKVLYPHRLFPLPALPDHHAPRRNRILPPRPGSESRHADGIRVFAYERVH